MGRSSSAKAGKLALLPGVTVSPIAGSAQGLRQSMRRGRALARLRDMDWATRVASAHVDPATCSVEHGELVLAELDIRIPRVAPDVLLRGHGHAIRLATAAGAAFRYDDGVLLVEIEGLELEVETVAQLYHLREVFVDGVYNIEPRRASVVWDIGAHSAAAALYLATNEHIVVWGEEPFSETVALARRNLERNRSVSTRVTLRERAIGSSSRHQRLWYDAQSSDRLGFHTRPSGDDSATPERYWQDVTVVAAVDAFEQVISAHPNRDVVVKLDCEGAEYEILPALHESGRLKRVRAVMMEWHRTTAEQEPDQLVSVLRRAGFLSWCRQFRGETGFIYAARESIG